MSGGHLAPEAEIELAIQSGAAAKRNPDGTMPDGAKFELIITNGHRSLILLEEDVDDDV